MPSVASGLLDHGVSTSDFSLKEKVPNVSFAPIDVTLRGLLTRWPSHSSSASCRPRLASAQIDHLGIPPAGPEAAANDEFIEIYNAPASTTPLRRARARGYGVAASDGGHTVLDPERDRSSRPAGTISASTRSPTRSPPTRPATGRPPLGTPPTRQTFPTTRGSRSSTTTVAGRTSYSPTGSTPSAPPPRPTRSTRKGPAIRR